MVEFMPNFCSNESCKANAHAASSPVGEIAIHNRELYIRVFCGKFNISSCASKKADPSGAH
jgi:hypothetical protein